MYTNPIELHIIELLIEKTKKHQIAWMAFIPTAGIEYSQCWITTLRHDSRGYTGIEVVLSRKGYDNNLVLQIYSEGGSWVSDRCQTAQPGHFGPSGQKIIPTDFSKLQTETLLKAIQDVNLNDGLHDLEMILQNM